MNEVTPLPTKLNDHSAARRAELARMVDELIEKRRASSPTLRGAHLLFMVERDIINRQLDFDAEQHALALAVSLLGSNTPKGH